MMPGMSGMALHAWLATEHPALAAQVVFVTGGAFTPAASAYVTRVGNPRMEKPYDNAKLKQLVADMIVAARATPTLGAANGD
jgi:FixJ family two-component response regulator